MRETIPFAELVVTTNFSFLRGASHPEELVARAIELGLAGMGIADRNSLAGVVRAHVFLRENKETAQGLRLAIGTRLVFRDGTPDILAFPKNRVAYGRITRLLTRGKLRAQKGHCLLDCEDLLDNAEGQQLIVMGESTWEEEDAKKTAGQIYDDFSEDTPSSSSQAAKSPQSLLRLLREVSDGNVWLAACMTYGRDMRRQLAARVDLAQRSGLPLLATNDVLMHDAARRPLQDVLTAIRHGMPLDTIGRRLEANAERHLKDGGEMARLFAEAPQAVAETIAFLSGLAFSLDELAYDYPQELREGYASPQDALQAFADAGARKRYPTGVPQRVAQAIAHELKLVAALNYAPYFLTVHDIVRFARDQGILCQGRGSAANSALCFCLGITEVDPAKHELLFERFISAERKEPPDIDVDFEHERREEVMQYVYARYGRARAGLTASVITYRTRSALRDVGKAFGLSEDSLNALSSTVWGGASGKIEDKEVRRAGLVPEEPRLAKVLALAAELAGFPRHLSQHTGGFVITHTRLDEVVPIAPAAMADRTTVEWDKDDLDALGILKIDVLALGMLTCLRKGFDLLRDHYGFDHTLASLPAEERAVYAMISRADTIGVFQIESRAQMSMLPRLRPAAFYDLVIEVAIVRPGPIQGDMVHPYLRRRQGLEPVNYPSKELEAVLGKTLGVPLFQEQAMKIAIVAAGFTPAEADRLRRAMATFKRSGTIGKFREKMISGMIARNYTRDFAERCFKQIEGFGTYGFPESHAASFALLVYASAWMKCRYPDVFACALLNSQPMGFYAPAQILRDAREHGVAFEDIDVNFSQWHATLSQGGGLLPLHPHHSSMQREIRSTHAIRLGFQHIKGIAEPDMTVLVANRGKGYDSIRDLWLRTGLSPHVLVALAEADAFRSLGFDRRDALWAVRGLNRAGDKDDLPLLKELSFHATEPEVHLPAMPLGEHVVEDYRHLSLSLKAHPVAFLRERLAARNMIRTEELARQSGRRITTAGLVLVRQRPGSAKGVIFLTMEDETGVANAIIWPKVFEKLRPIVIAARFIAVTGRVQSESDVTHIIVERAEDLTPWLGLLSRQGGEISSLARADAVKRPHDRDPREAPKQAGLFDREAQDATQDASDDLRRVLPKGRNFH
ncbi:MAG: error-prone DNA polymerase [Beijerinckiaceae bacterium]